DAVIDFTAPAATVTHAGMAAAAGKVLVVGTTGLSKDDEAKLQQAADRVPVVYAPNFSVGVNLLMALTERAASILGDDYDIEIVEMHHRHKVDAPSGTALGLGRAAAAGRGVPLDSVWCKARDGHTGARPKGEIGFATLRGGDVVGDHTVMFAAEGERVELTHKASSRAVFAKGAVRAALWAKGKPAGLYTMRDVLGL
ncbi:MAG TPA: 4-hydroxy-tetrahydrodipicolinate reductase, partial [Candidatus Omnitrophota bacterium]|nr:4-hydroxy-tetrahydrodipicolinate reductase [Candidatus Omnitrophota bacterium]